MSELHLGIGRSVITPEVGGQLYGYRPDVLSESVADDLTATAFYFVWENRKALMISATVCLINTGLSEEILDKIEKECGIPAECCILNATHTHSGPNTAGEYGWGDIDRAYCDGIFIPGILNAVKEAMSSLEPVTVGSASGISLTGINRRELTFDNQVALGQCEWGSFNPKITVVSFKNAAGKVVGNMIHYGCHGTAAGANHEISRDWSGHMTDALEALTGGITAFFNGPEGDVGPRLSNGLTVGDISYVHELGAIAARDAITVYNQIKEYTSAEIYAATKTVDVPLKERISLEEAKNTYEEYKEHTVNLSGSIKRHCEKVIASYEEGYEDRKIWELPQTIIFIGNLAFVSFPYELFSEIGMRIDRQCKELSVLSLSNTNGSEGYFVTEDQIIRGGYEVAMHLYGHLQSYGKDADWHLVKGTVANLQKEKKDA